MFKGKSPSKHNVIELLINQPTNQVNCFDFFHVGISLYNVVNWAFRRELTNCWLITDSNRKEGIKKASDCTCGKSQKKGKCGAEQGEECNGNKCILSVLLGIDIFQFSSWV